MIQYDHWSLPDGETHLQWWMQKRNRIVEGRKTYQFEKYEAALKFCECRRVAVDIGAHVGLFSYWMARDFEFVEAFEPKKEHAACWLVNMASRTNTALHLVALGADYREVGLVTAPTSSGDTTVDLDGRGVMMQPLDRFDLDRVDFIKIDCEGYEAMIVEGAEQTILRSRPVVMVEQKPGHGKRFGRGELDAVKILQAMGATKVWDYSGDYVLRF